MFYFIFLSLSCRLYQAIVGSIRYCLDDTLAHCLQQVGFLYHIIVGQYNLFKSHYLFDNALGADAQRDGSLAQRGASTKFHAGDKRSISHKIFCGTTAPLAPNRTVVRSAVFRECCQIIVYCFLINLSKSCINLSSFVRYINVLSLSPTIVDSLSSSSFHSAQYEKEIAIFPPPIPTTLNGL